MVTRQRLRAIAVAAVAAAGLAWSAASSGLTISNTVVGGPNLWSDNDGEVLIDLFGGTVGGFPTVDPGDLLVSALGFRQYNATDGSAVTNEATALVILRVVTAVAQNPASCGGAPSCHAYTFGAPLLGFNAIAGLFGLGPYLDADGNPLAPGTVGIVFFDDSKDFFTTAAPDFSANVLQMFTQAQNGTVEATLGLTSFTGNAPRNLVELTSGNATILPGQGAGGFSFVLPVLSQSFPGFIITSALTGTANISEPSIGPLVNVGIRTDTSVAFTAIPEPATVALLGISLLGMGLANRRRNNKAS